MADQETIGTAGATHSLPRVRAITPRDLVDVLAKGFDDFWALKWSRFSEQIFRIDKWSLCQG